MCVGVSVRVGLSVRVRRFGHSSHDVCLEGRGEGDWGVPVVVGMKKNKQTNTQTQILFGHE